MICYVLQVFVVRPKPMKLTMDHFYYYFLTMDAEVLGNESWRNVQMRVMLVVKNVPGGVG